MTEFSKITKEETEQHMELVRENVRLQDQSSSNAPFISMTAAFHVVYTKEQLAALLP